MNKSTIRVERITKINLFASLLFLSSCGGGGGASGGTTPIISNAAPIFNSATSINVPENTTSTGYLATATDSNGDSLSYSIVSGEDQNLFSIDSISGALNFANSPNFENPLDADANNGYLVGISVDDGKGGSDRIDLVVTVTNVIEPPTLISGTSISVLENVMETGYFAEAIVDSSGVPSYNLSGGADQSLFNIDSTTGALFFAVPPDFEIPSDADNNNIYLIQIAVNDNQGGSDVLQLNINVTDVESHLTVEISYPTANSNLGGSAVQTTVTGRLTDIEDGLVTSSDINFISVNGLLATISSNDPSRWSVVIPITPFENTLSVTVESTSQAIGMTQQIVNNSIFSKSLRTIALDSENNRAFVTDFGNRSLLEVELSSGNLIAISDSSKGVGPLFSFPVSISMDKDNNRVLIVDSGLRALIAVDLTNGDRTILSDDITGSGPVFSFPKAAALDKPNNRMLVLMQGNSVRGMLAVDLTTGNRTAFSDRSNGTGPDINAPTSIVIDAANNQALVLDVGFTPFSTGPLLAVDLTSGDRRVISNSLNGSGPDFSSAQSIALDSTNNKVFVIDRQLRALFSVDLATGDRTIISDDSIGSGDILIYPSEIVLDSGNNRVLLLEDVLREIDLTNGDRSTITSNSVGIGKNFRFPTAVAIDQLENQAIVLDRGLDTLFRVDLTNGSRSIMSDPSNSGPTFSIATSLAIDKLHNRVLVADEGLSALIAVDLDAGERSFFSNFENGSGPNIVSPSGIVLDPDSNRALFLDFSLGSLLAVDLNSSIRTVISNSLLGNGPFMFSPLSVAYDKENDKAFVQDLDNGLLEINFINGDRKIISGGSIGEGPDFSFTISITFDQQKNRIVAVDSTQDSLLEVDLISGDRNAISNSVVGNGLDFIDPSYVALDIEHNRAFVIDSGLDALMVVELDSGERAIASK